MPEDTTPDDPAPERATPDPAPGEHARRAAPTASSRRDDPEEVDRVVSRRVDHPTAASAADERAYAAADPLPGGGAADSVRGATGGIAGSGTDPESAEPQRSQ